VRTKTKKNVPIDVIPIDRETIKEDEFLFTADGICFKVKDATLHKRMQDNPPPVFRAHFNTCINPLPKRNPESSEPKEPLFRNKPRVDIDDDEITF
jgi:hypothetical protein